MNMPRQAGTIKPSTWLLPTWQAAFNQYVTLDGMRLHVPGSFPIRLSVVLGNLRMQRLFARLLKPGATVVDVGANIGYNTAYAARCVGSHGRVYALEPTQDNLAVLYANLFANALSNVIVLPYAAGSRAAVKEFFLRGAVSAVNSLYPDNFYADVTDTSEVLMMPLDDLLMGVPDLVKIDVEGAELDVLQGMTRLLAAPGLQLVVEWHPVLQEAGGHAPDALPRFLLEHGFVLQAISHTTERPLLGPGIPELTDRLLRKRTPVELLATRR